MNDSYYLDPCGNVVLRFADWPIDDDGDLLCWGSAGSQPNTTDIETLWYAPALLAMYQPITEAQAREAHPAFFAHLAALNQAEAPRETQTTVTLSCGHREEYDHPLCSTCREWLEGVPCDECADRLVNDPPICARFCLREPPAEWSGSCCPDAPDQCWIDDATGEHVDATTNTRTPTHPTKETR